MRGVCETKAVQEKSVASQPKGLTRANRCSRMEAGVNAALQSWYLCGRHATGMSPFWPAHIRVRFSSPIACERAWPALSSAAARSSSSEGGCWGRAAARMRRIRLLLSWTPAVPL